MAVFNGLAQAALSLHLTFSGVSDQGARSDVTHVSNSVLAQGQGVKLTHSVLDQQYQGALRCFARALADNGHHGINPAWTAGDIQRTIADGEDAQWLYAYFFGDNKSVIDAKIEAYGELPTALNALGASVGKAYEAFHAMSQDRGGAQAWDRFSADDLKQAYPNITIAYDCAL